MEQHKFVVLLGKPTCIFTIVSQLARVSVCHRIERFSYSSLPLFGSRKLALVDVGKIQAVQSYVATINGKDFGSIYMYI